MGALLDRIHAACSMHGVLSRARQGEGAKGQAEDAGNAEQLPRSEVRSPRRLELFARELRPGWVSVGDEAVLFQQPTFFFRHHGEEDGSGNDGGDGFGNNDSDGDGTDDDGGDESEGEVYREGEPALCK